MNCTLTSELPYTGCANISGPVTAYIEAMSTHINNIITDKIRHAVKVHARPRIKGRVFKAKLERNDIVIKQKNTGSDLLVWVEQYGLMISPKISVNDIAKKYALHHGFNLHFNYIAK
jgi:hypothetical protein